MRLKSEFSRNVLTLMTGSALAQAIPIALSPILTRLYTPEEFGVLALFLALSSLLAVIATFRYELAIIQPRKDEDAASLVILSSMITFSLFCLLSLGIFFFKQQILNILGHQNIGNWLYLTPISVLLAGFYQTLSYWSTREKQFKAIAFSRIAQGISAPTSQVALKAFPSTGGLIFGHIIGQATAVWMLLSKIIKQDKNTFSFVTRELITKNAKTYSKFPKYSTFGGFADTASLQMPILMLSKFYEMGVTGLFSLTFKVLNLPVSLVAKALSQVLFQRISHMHHHSPAKIYRMILKLFLLLLILMLPFISFIWIFGEDLFAFIFGENWREAGSMATVLVFAAAIRFAVSPLSSILAMEHNVKLGTLWQIIYLTTITSTLYFFSRNEIETFITAFVIHEIILYSLYLAFILKGSKYIMEVQ